MKTKQQFLEAVEILAPGDSFVLEAAQRVEEENLPSVPGAAALEFVVALERLRARLVGSRRSSGQTRACGQGAQGCRARAAAAGSQGCAGTKTVSPLPVAWPGSVPASPVCIQRTAGSEFMVQE